jgi:hypothetical protein
MKLGRIADFLFIGLGIVPAMLMLPHFPELAILNLIPLIFAACLFGMSEQSRDDGEPGD